MKISCVRVLHLVLVCLGLTVSPSYGANVSNKMQPCPEMLRHFRQHARPLLELQEKVLYSSNISFPRSLLEDAYKVPVVGACAACTSVTGHTLVRQPCGHLFCEICVVAGNEGCRGCSVAAHFLYPFSANTSSMEHLNAILERMQPEEYLRVAILLRDPLLVRYFAQIGCSINQRIENKTSLLSYAVGLNVDPAMIALLLQLGADIELADHHEERPLHIAAERGHIGIIQALLEKKPALEVSNRLGLTPLSLAAGCYNPQSEAVELLLAAGADPNTRFFEVPLVVKIIRSLQHSSYREAQFKIITLLLRFGAVLDEITGQDVLSVQNFLSKYDQGGTLTAVLEGAARRNLRRSSRG